jgi:hypothetical protein
LFPDERRTSRSSSRRNNRSQIRDDDDEFELGDRSKKKKTKAKRKRSKSPDSDDGESSSSRSSSRKSEIRREQNSHANISGADQDEDEDENQVETPDEDLLHRETRDFLLSVPGEIEKMSFATLRLHLTKAIPALANRDVCRAVRPTLQKIVRYELERLNKERVRNYFEPYNHFRMNHSLP